MITISLPLSQIPCINTITIVQLSITDSHHLYSSITPELNELDPYAIPFSILLFFQIFLSLIPIFSLQRKSLQKQRPSSSHLNCCLAEPESVIPPHWVVQSQACKPEAGVQTEFTKAWEMSLASSSSIPVSLNGSVCEDDFMNTLKVMNKARKPC